jgi:hypothetical protein
MELRNGGLGRAAAIGKGSRPIELIAWTADLAQTNGAGCCVHALGANPANPRRAGAQDLLQNLVLAAVRLAPHQGDALLLN